MALAVFLGIFFSEKIENKKNYVDLLKKEILARYEQEHILAVELANHTNKSVKTWKTQTRNQAHEITGHRPRLTPKSKELR